MDPVQGKITDLLEPEAEKRILAMRQPGIEPGSTAWKAAMLTTIPLTLTSAASLLLVHNTALVQRRRTGWKAGGEKH